MAQAVAEDSTRAHEPDVTDKQRLVHPKMGLLFIVVVGSPPGDRGGPDTPMVAGCKRIFEMSTFQASLVQLAYYGA